MIARILVADADVLSRSALRRIFEREGFDVETERDGAAALATVLADRFDLLVVDAALPSVAGTELCRRLRQHGRTTPVLMLSAHDSETERVRGLDLGADDYVAKPFPKRELVSRVRALLRRRTLDRTPSPTVRDVGSLRLDLARHVAFVEGVPVQLTRAEYRLLAALTEEPGRVYTRRQLLAAISDGRALASDHACEVHISNLRRKIERDPARPTRILTIRASGYKLVPA